MESSSNSSILSCPWPLPRLPANSDPISESLTVSDSPSASKSIRFNVNQTGFFAETQNMSPLSISPLSELRYAFTPPLVLPWTQTGFLPATSKRTRGSLPSWWSWNNSWRRETARSLSLTPAPLPNTVMDPGMSRVMEPPQLSISIFHYRAVRCAVPRDY
nr:hypothetical protein PanWU01x14_239590 [Ipomoea batatas]